MLNLKIFENPSINLKVSPTYRLIRPIPNHTAAKPRPDLTPRARLRYSSSSPLSGQTALAACPPDQTPLLLPPSDLPLFGRFRSFSGQPGGLPTPKTAIRPFYPSSSPCQQTNLCKFPAGSSDSPGRGFLSTIRTASPLTSLSWSSATTAALWMHPY